MAWQHLSPEVTVKCFKKCCISNAMTRLMMFVQRMGMLRVWEWWRHWVWRWRKWQWLLEVI